MDTPPYVPAILVHLYNSIESAITFPLAPACKKEITHIFLFSSLRLVHKGPAIKAKRFLLEEGFGSHKKKGRRVEPMEEGGKKLKMVALLLLKVYSFIYLQINEKRNDGSAEGDEITELQEQVETLSASLLTLTEEKSKLEASYVSDKKALKVNINQVVRLGWMFWGFMAL